MIIWLCSEATRRLKLLHDEKMEALCVDVRNELKVPQFIYVRSSIALIRS